MGVEEVQKLCLNLKGTTIDFPFDNVTMVFRVGNKMYALCNIEKNKSINLKCDPQLALLLREEYKSIQSGYHMNKKHWNTLDFEGDIPKDKFIELIKHSYNLVFKSLTKKMQKDIKDSL